MHIVIAANRKGSEMKLELPTVAVIEYFGCISADGLEVYIDKPVSGGTKSLNGDIYVNPRND